MQNKIIMAANFFLKLPLWLLKKIFRAWQIYILLGEWVFIQLGFDREEPGRWIMRQIRIINFIKKDDKLPFDMPDLRLHK